MDFSLTHEQQTLVDTVRRFIRQELYPLEQQVELEGSLSDSDAIRIFEKARALGLYAVNMPESLGGGGLSNLDRILCEEQFGYTTDILVRRAFGNVYEPLLHCKGEQLTRWALPAVRGERTCSIAITETGAGSDAAGIATKAEKTRDGWLLNGAKHFISDGLWSDFFLVSAKTGPNEISMFMVDKALPGFKVGNDQKMMGLRGTPHVELFFDQVPLHEDALLGARGEGFKLAMSALNVVRLAQVGARAVGKATHICEMTLEWIRQRKQFGTRIGDFQMVQQQVADSVIEINASRWMVYHAAWMLDQGLDAREYISMVKVHAAEMLGRVVDRAVQLHGGMGYCRDLPIERFYRDARIYRIYDGTSEIHRGVIAKAAMKKGAALFDLNR
ncbi:MAG: acyl-CoA dehydrogenase [Burkholderiaceae bacterium]